MPQVPAPHTSKGFVAGTHRIVPPEETLERIAPMLGAMGVTRTATITGLDRLRIPVVAVMRPNARSLSVTQGKGLTLAAAKASAQMEAIESFHAERILAPLKHASFNDLRYSHPVIDLERLPRLTVSTFHSDQRTLWIEGTDLMSQTLTWVPYEVVHTDFSLPLPPGSGCFVMSSNGLASGNHVLEAISHGICEVVERDAVTLFRLRVPSQRRRVPLSSIDDGDCREIIERFRAADVAVAVWDATSDVGLPCFYCAIADERTDVFRPLYANQGMGCHLSSKVALLRALTEAAQSRLTFIAGARDDAGRDRYRHVQSTDYVTRWRARILGEESAGARPFCEVPSFENRSFEEDIAVACDRLSAVGIDEMVVVDLTRPEFGIPVVRVVIPGLEPLDEVPGYRPGPRARAIARAKDVSLGAHSTP